VALLSSPRNRAIAGAVVVTVVALVTVAAFAGLRSNPRLRCRRQRDGGGKDLPNTWYVYGVEGFMTNQPWNS